MRLKLFARISRKHRMTRITSSFCLIDQHDNCHACRAKQSKWPTMSMKRDDYDYREEVSLSWWFSETASTRLNERTDFHVSRPPPVIPLTVLRLHETPLNLPCSLRQVLFNKSGYSKTRTEIILSGGYESKSIRIYLDTNTASRKD